MIAIKPMLPDQWQLHKSVRTRAVADAPYAFSTTLARTLGRSDDEWQRLTRQRASDPNQVTYFAFDVDRPCGMSACILTEGDAEMQQVWVDPDYRRRGVGDALVEFAQTWSKSHGVKCLKVGVFDDNVGAVQFYLNAGFQDVGLTKPEISTDERTGLILVMDLI